MKKKKLIVSGKAVSCAIVRRKGMKRLLLSVRSDGTLLLSAPRLTPLFFIEQFLNRSKEWIEKRFTEYSENSTLRKKAQEEYEQKRDEARLIISDRVARFAQKLGVSYNKISIRDQRTRWGSCSRSGNLSFSYRIAFLSDRYLDYVIVHELGHRLYFDHSRKFWNAVGSIIPDYKNIRKEMAQMRENTD